eukprot:scaffold183521_cov29-Tisochrysis_lutea.AAC.1
MGHGPWASRGAWCSTFGLDEMIVIEAQEPALPVARHRVVLSALSGPSEVCQRANAVPDSKQQGQPPSFHLLGGSPTYC